MMTTASKIPKTAPATKPASKPVLKWIPNLCSRFNILPRLNAEKLRFVTAPSGP